MAVLPVLRYPAPQLRQVAAPVAGPSPELAGLIQDLIDTLEASPGCVGIAAPQVGALHRVIIVDASRYRKPVPNQGRLIAINPVLVLASGRAVSREGCLSLPDFTANVPRATTVEYQAVDQDGVSRSIRATGFEAVILQHETDHLDGVLFIDRVVSLTTDLFPRRERAPRQAPPPAPAGR